MSPGRLLTDVASHLHAQVYNPYNNPYTLPIPTSIQPSAVTTAPNLNYPQAASGGLMALANATEFFALRFLGEQATRNSVTDCFGALTPALFHIANTLPGSLKLSMLRTGYIIMPGNMTADYTFSMDSDDGSLLLIDGQQVISDPGADCAVAPAHGPRSAVASDDDVQPDAMLRRVLTLLHTGYYRTSSTLLQPPCGNLCCWSASLVQMDFSHSHVA